MRLKDPKIMIEDEWMNHKVLSQTKPQGDVHIKICTS